ncbi:MAG: DUF2497 domain-containing protein [Novosphingobium sp.]
MTPRRRMRLSRRSDSTLCPPQRAGQAGRTGVGQPGEQSVGEILESIRKVMERDDRAVGTAPGGDADSLDPGAADDGPAPVLELTDAHLEPVAAPGVTSAEPLELREAPAPQPVAAAAAPADDPARAALRDLLAALAPSPRGVPPGETSLEGLTRELLRPMLAEWLDRNLPALAEKLLAAEIARIRDRRG